MSPRPFLVSFKAVDSVDVGLASRHIDRVIVFHCVPLCLTLLLSLIVAQKSRCTIDRMSFGILMEQSDSFI